LCRPRRDALTRCTGGSLGKEVQMAEQDRWIVTLSSDRPLADLRSDLAEAGFAVDQELEEIGVVTGRCDEAAAGKVRRLRGVTDVSKDMPIDIGPPDSPTTW
jgi:hypothetical protein